MDPDYGTQLKEDFLDFLKMCKDPDIAFPPNSDESKLAKKWIDHLCTYETENLYDRRLKNIYMSHLCAALIDGKLKGPFVREPVKDKLENVDFEAVPADQLDSLTIQPTYSTQLLQSYGLNDADLNYSSLLPANVRETVSESQGRLTVDSANANISLPQPCQCGREGNQCTCNRSKGGANSTTSNRHLKEDVLCNYLMNDLKASPEILNEFNTSLTSIMHLCKVAPINGETQFLPKSQPLLAEKKTTQSNLVETSVDQIASTSLSSPDYAALREDIIKLLEAISAELSGSIEPGTNDYLERELSRYRAFIMDYSKLAPHYETLTSGFKLRNSLLLNLQNDLVKLLNDNLL